MELLFDSIPEGIKLAIQPLSIVLMIAGAIIGILVGILPGIGGPATMAILLPFTFGMRAEYAILLFIGILCGNAFGNSIPAILMKVPGSSSSVLTCIEGYEFTKRGQAGKALGISMISASIGQLLSVVLFLVLMVPLGGVGGPHWLALFGCHGSQMALEVVQ